ncbi:hypothetical protein Q3O59_02030 [Alkalimonas delamerensis]|uniref:Uncharacterized protein n=1 Tax=Alkalimonas delamerensis TaxID=265981 RepID=A0ABT9GLG4_9GAMM|nr:hypothetical protein [Alkalimonas delamerensis]MDP4527810.1 hypothetical protein [Alkalimonas delamerensis]
MKNLLTTVVATCFVVGLAIAAKGADTSGETKLDAEPLLACAWFPFCWDPDLEMHQNLGSESIDAMEDAVA